MAPSGDVRSEGGRARRTVLLVRHADALGRAGWDAPDARRPLSELGRRQALALGERVAPGDRSAGGVARCVASPALRCRETVGPLAARAGLEVEELGELAEGRDPLVALELLLDSARLLSDGASLVACSHGDVIDGILETFGPGGVDVVGPLRAPKASVWELTVAGGVLLAARFEPPPNLVAQTEPRRDR